MTHPDRSDADLRLAKAFAMDAPSPRDPGFTLAVMAQVSRRKLTFDIVRAALVTAFASMILWALWPVVRAAFDLIAVETWQALGPALAALVVVASLLALEQTSTRFGRAL